ncbi:hypothetical protein ACLOJK_035392 [Asimina triloba]
MWPLGFWVSSASAFVCIAALPLRDPEIWEVEMPPNAEDLHGVDGKVVRSSTAKISKFLGSAAVTTAKDFTIQDQAVVFSTNDAFALLLPIWLCTIFYPVVFTQMASLFADVALFFFYYQLFLNSLVRRLNMKSSGGLTDFQRMGARVPNSLSILWHIPQYTLIGASEVFMYVGQLKFFNGQAPDGLMSFGSAHCLTSISLGNYVSSLLVTIVMVITIKGGSPVAVEMGSAEDFAPTGLTNTFNCGGTIQEVEYGDGMKMKGGRFLCYSSVPPKRSRWNGAAVVFEWLGGGKLMLDIIWAGEDGISVVDLDF